MTLFDKAKKAINLFNLFSILFLMFTLVVRNYELQKFAYFLFFITYFIEIIIEKKWKNIQLTKRTVYFFSILFFFLLALAYYPFEESDRYFKLLIEKRYPLLGFSIVGIFGAGRSKVRTALLR